jgi:hypothetical protein
MAEKTISIDTSDFTNIRPSDFPMLTSYIVGRGLQSEERYVKALRYIDEGLRCGEIRNIAWKESKDALSRFVDHAWEKLIDEPYFWGQRDQSEDLYQFGWDVRVSGLHGVTASKKRADKTKLEGPAVDAARNLLHELQPLTDAVNSLKAHIVKGRAPNPDPKPENPNKVVRTCPCCFRSIAVQSNRMVHHGYERPWEGMQTASCMGIRYKPLERSDEGLRAAIIGTEKHIARRENDLAEKESKTTLSVKNNRGQLIEITPDHKGWASALTDWEYRVKRDIHLSKETLIALKDKLSGWRQTEFDPERPDAEFETPGGSPKGPKVL